jgi:hypothetical protein
MGFIYPMNTLSFSTLLMAKHYIWIKLPSFLVVCALIVYGIVASYAMTWLW